MIEDSANSCVSASKSLFLTLQVVSGEILEFRKRWACMGVRELHEEGP